MDPNIIEKVVNTICAIANNGAGREGKIIIGVTDKDEDARRIEEIDGITPNSVGVRYVVGVNREAVRLGKTTEGYFSLWKNGIKNSSLQQNLKEEVLSNIDYNAFFGLGVIVITIPPQKDLSYAGKKLYYREGSETCEATEPRQIASLAKRF